MHTRVGTTPLHPMPRRKHRSRNLLESADGWATVPGRNRPPVRLAVPALEDRLEQLSLSPPPRPPPSPPSRPRATCELLSLLAHELDGAYSILCAHPVLTPVRHALRLLHKHLRKPRGVQRRRWRRRRLVVLVLGLGSLEGATSSSSLLQLAMVLEIVDALAAGGASGEGGGEEVKVVFRDPAFTSADKAFLRQRWTVQDVGVGDVPDDCDDGGGGGEEDAAADPADTVLIAPHLDFDVLAQHLRDTRVRRRPVLLVANDLEQFMDLSVPIHLCYQLTVVGVVLTTDGAWDAL